jgi:hypothetical protein
MAIVSSVTGRALPGVYILQVDPPPQANLNVGTGVGVLVAEANWGPVNTVTQVTSLAEYIRKFGNKGNGFAQAYGFFQGGQKSGINGGGADLRMIRVAGTSQAFATNTLVDNAGTPAIVLTVTAKFRGTRGNDIQIQCIKNDGTFDLLVIPPDGLPPESFRGLTKATAAAAVNGVSEWVTVAAGVSNLLPEPSTSFLSGGNDGTSADADYVGVAGPPATGLELAKTITDGNLPFTGKQSAAIKTALSTTSSVLLGVGIAGPNDENVTTAAAITDQAFNNEYLTYCYSYITWLNPVTKAVETVFPAGDIAGALANGEYWQNPTGIRINRALAVANPVSDPVAETLAKAGINAITSGRTGIILRSGLNTSTDASKNQADDTRIRTYLAKVLDESLLTQWSKPLTDDWYDDTKSLIDGIFDAQPDEVIRRRAGQPGHAVSFDKSFEAQNRVVIYIQAIITGKALQIIVNAQMGRTVSLTIASAA